MNQQQINDISTIYLNIMNTVCSTCENYPSMKCSENCIDNNSELQYLFVKHQFKFLMENKWTFKTTLIATITSNI